MASHTLPTHPVSKLKITKHKNNGGITQHYPFICVWLFSYQMQTSLVIPEAEGYMVYSSTQWTQRTQAAVAAVLGINNSRSACIP